jgi:F0F1-type ATP synthase membrane subunit b/b'
MMAVTLLDDLARRGVRLWPEGGKLIAEPADRLTDADRAAIRAAKPALLAHLRAQADSTAAEAALTLLRRLRC